MTIRLYNSLSRKKEEFVPLIKDRVAMYVCGPTVYDLSHIGHARSAVAFDVIYHYLKYRGYQVTYVRNYTDVDDKIIKRANDEGNSSAAVAERYIEAFDRDMADLGVSPADFRPKATETIDEMIALIAELIERDYAYTVETDGGGGDVYFKVRNFAGYGQLSGKNIEDLESGARVDVDERKDDPLDFSLWKASKAGEPSWKSPWGEGRPGWHIECSAMSRKFLGATIDIHGGGKDLIFPHHENEIAQSEAASGQQFVKYWLHNGFVNMDTEKMSKSLGNILLIRDVLKQYHRETLRLFFLSSHYRSPIEYSEKNLKEAEAALERVYTTLARVDEACESAKGAQPAETEPLSGIGNETEERASRLVEEFEHAMDDDFNTAMVVGQIFELVRSVNRFMDDGAAMKSSSAPAILTAAGEAIQRVGAIFGLFTTPPADYLRAGRERFLASASLTSDEIEGLIVERKEARQRKDFARADEIRRTLDERGVELKDSATGTDWKVKDQ